MHRREHLTSQFPFHTIPANNILACSTGVNFSRVGTDFHIRPPSWICHLWRVRTRENWLREYRHQMEKMSEGKGREKRKRTKCNGPGHCSNTDRFIQSHATKPTAPQLMKAEADLELTLFLMYLLLHCSTLSRLSGF